MAVRGVKPKPTALKLIEGNPGKRALRPEPKPERALPVKPEWFAKGAAVAKYGGAKG